ncbi:MAG: hypothetical protein PVJ04_14975, partial [Gemmatimonadota bacterium]
SAVVLLAAMAAVCDRAPELPSGARVSCDTIHGVENVISGAPGRPIPPDPGEIRGRAKRKRDDASPLTASRRWPR